MGRDSGIRASRAIHRPSNNHSPNRMASSPLWDEAIFILELNRKRQALGERYTLKELPHPQVLFTLGFSNLKPAPSRVST